MNNVEYIGPNSNQIGSGNNTYFKEVGRDGALNEDGELHFEGQNQLLLELERDKFNTYATSKSVSQNLLNTSVITQYIGIVINLFTIRNVTSGFTGFQIALLTFICLSFLLQFVIFTLLVILSKSKNEKVGKRCTTTSINAFVTSLTGISTIVTILITALGVQVQSEASTQTQTPTPTP